jgi:hypothetical protein
VNLVETLPTITAAGAQAQRNFNANARAISECQPWMTAQIHPQELAVTWLFGRDGFLTGHDENGQWLSGCSLPLRAGQMMMKQLAVNGVVGCLLAPSHAAQITAALEKLTPEQAIIVIQPDAEVFQIMLRCCDLSEAIRLNRLWFAVGPQWLKALEVIFENRPGLLTPCQFIRTLATDENLMQQLIPPAERVFQSVNEARALRLEQVMNRSNARDPKSILIVAGSHFRLWEDSGNTLIESLSHGDWKIDHCDPDDPAQTSAIGLAVAAAGRQAVILPHRSRREMPGVFGKETRVLTWITQPHIPGFDPEHPHDGLMLADGTWMPLAVAAGWPGERVIIASWPIVAAPPAPEKCLAMIAHTRSLETPVTTLELSSHHVLWEMIRTDLLADPFALGTDIHSFLNRRMAKLKISEEGLDRDRFINELVVPAYQQGLLKLLVDANIPIKLFGRGWGEFPRMSEFWQGEIKTRESLLSAIASVSALIYAWPLRYRHAIDALLRPILTPTANRANSWIRDARRILNEPPAASRSLPSLSFEQLEPLLN